MSLHHVTTIASDAQAAVEFYAGFLGLRLVKRTAGAADPRQHHLFFGDGAGSSGTLVTCLVWEHAGPGPAGVGAFGENAMAVPEGAHGFWLGHCLEPGLAQEGPVREVGEPVLRLKDPDGLIV
jgi:phospholipase/carboxylesterase